MSCKDFGEYQAFIDGELSRGQRKQLAQHLKICKECQDAISNMKELDDWIGLNLEGSFSDENTPLEINHQEAWKRFNVQLHEVELQSAKEVNMKRWRWSMMNQSTKRWIASIASTAVIIGALCIPQVQTVASEFLSIFRLNKVEFVQLTAEDLSKIKDAIQNKTGERINLKELGKMSVKAEGKGRSFSTLKQANKAGVILPVLPHKYKLEDQIYVNSSFNVSFQLKTEKVNKLLQQMKSSVTIDQSVNNKVFAVHIPEQVSFTFKDKASTFSFTEMEVPEIRVEKGTDVNELRKVVLSLPFIPNNIKTQLVDLNDWQHTLVIPVLQEKKKAREVKVNGAKGIIQESEYNSTIMWQKDGKLRTLWSDKININKLIQIAESIA